MKIMIRSFLPVGQGAFYLEQFRCGSEKINVVYDCGSDTDVNLVQYQIDDMFDQGETIHAVFISHLHEDHMNGLTYLMKRCQVKRLFFPLLAKESQISLCLEYSIRDIVDEDNFFIRFIENPKEAIEEFFREHNLDYSITLHPVMPDQMDDDYDNEWFDQGENASDRIQVEPAKSGQSVCQDVVCKYTKEWLYIPFNFREKKRSEELMEALVEIFGHPCSLKDLLNACKSNPSTIYRIKNAYKTVSGQLNTNSLVLFSGCKDLKMVQCAGFDRFWNTYCFHSHCLPSGCLYTGDYEASGTFKWNELESAYKDYYDYIGCLQIPHHGSRHNFNIKFLDFPRCELYIASAGYRNKHRHPHSSVIKEILVYGKSPIIVNEFPGSAVHLYICYR